MKRALSPQITIKILPVGQMAAYCYIVKDSASGQAVIIDPGDSGEFIVDSVRTIEAVPQMILATHGHFDHIMAAFELQLAYQIPFLIHKEDVFLVDRMRETAQHFLGIIPVDPPPMVNATFEDGQTFQLGSTTFRIIHTPGHTPGSSCIVIEHHRSVFVGDTVFAGGGVGRYDFSYSDKQKLFDSVGRIFSYPDKTVLYPGHGASTTVSTEKKYHKLKT